MQNLRAGSIISIAVGQSQTSDVQSYSNAEVTHVANGYIEFELQSGAVWAYPWHRVLSISVTTP